MTKTKKNEPLRNKAFELDPNTDMEEGSAFWFKDVKLAVQGLLEEIKKEEKEREICACNVGGYDEGEAKFQSGFASGLRYAQHLIKKWFADVVKNENEK